MIPFRLHTIILNSVRLIGLNPNTNRMLLMCIYRACWWRHNILEISFKTECRIRPRSTLTLAPFDVNSKLGTLANRGSVVRVRACN